MQEHNRFFPCFFRFADHIDLHIVPHEGFDPLFAEQSFCLTFIDTGSCYVNVVESGNPFYNLTFFHRYSSRKLMDAV